MKVNSIQDLERMFISGKLKILPKDITVNSVVYKRREGSPSADLIDVLSKKALGSAIYTTVASPDVLKERNLRDAIVFLWGGKNLKVLPYKVVLTKKARFANISSPNTVSKLVSEGRKPSYQKELEDNASEVSQGDETVEIPKKKIVGDVEEITIYGINDNKPLFATIDTGADMCSLHAEDLDYLDNGLTKGSPVFFTFKEKRYKMPIASVYRVISPDGGVEYRPVVLFAVEFMGSTFKNVLFNLNDRSKMENPVLVGQNLLEAGDFLVNPSDNGISADKIEVVDNDADSENEENEKETKEDKKQYRDGLREFLEEQLQEYLETFTENDNDEELEGDV